MTRTLNIALICPYHRVWFGDSFLKRVPSSSVGQPEERPEAGDTINKELLALNQHSRRGFMPLLVNFLHNER